MITSELGRGLHAPAFPYDLASVAFTATAINTAEHRLPDRITNFLLLITEDAPGQQPTPDA